LQNSLSPEIAGLLRTRSSAEQVMPTIEQQG